MKKVYLIAVVFALIAGGATYLFAQTLESKTSFKDANTKTVLVASQDIPANTRMTASAIEQYFVEKAIVDEYIVSGAIQSKQEIANQVSKSEIYAGQQAQLNMFVGSDSEGASLSVELDAGEVAYSLKAEATNGVDGYIAEGDTIDVLAYVKTESDGSVNGEVVTAFEDVEVLRVATNVEQTEESAAVEYVSVTVKLSESDARDLYLVEQNAEIKLVLNSRGNN